MKFLPRPTISIACFLFFVLTLGSILIFRNSLITTWLREWIPGGLLTFAIMLVTLLCVDYLLQLYKFIYFRKLWYVSDLRWHALMALIIMSITVYFYVQEQITYENYVFGNFGIFLDYLVLFAVLVSPYIIFAFVRYRTIIGYLFQHNFRQTRRRSNHLERWRQQIRLFLLPRSKAFLLLLILFFIILLRSIVALLPWLVTEATLTKYYALLPIEDRYELAVGELHIEVAFVAKHIPKDAIVVHPPQSNTFPLVGNQVVIRYYLYPRTLVSGVMLDRYLAMHPDQDELYYILDSGLNLGESVYFPEKEFYSKKVILLVNDTVLYFDDQIVSRTWLESFDGFKIGVATFSL